MSAAPPKEIEQYRVDAVDAALGVLMLIAETPDLGLSELTRRSGQSKARVYRLLCSLEANGFVNCSTEKRSYRLGLAALAVGNAAARQIDIARAAFVTDTSSWMTDPDWLANLSLAVPWLAKCHPAELFLPHAHNQVFDVDYTPERALTLLDSLRPVFNIKRVETVHRGARVGRNDPCPCGSGKKFKKCCG